MQLAIAGKVGVASGKSADVAYFCWNRLEMQPADGASVGRRGVAELRRGIQRGKAGVKGHASRLQSVIVRELALRASAVHGHAPGPRFPFGTTRLITSIVPAQMLPAVRYCFTLFSPDSAPVSRQAGWGYLPDLAIRRPKQPGSCSDPGAFRRSYTTFYKLILNKSR